MLSENRSNHTERASKPAPLKVHAPQNLPELISQAGPAASILIRRRQLQSQGNVIPVHFEPHPPREDHPEKYIATDLSKLKTNDSWISWLNKVMEFGEARQTFSAESANLIKTLPANIRQLCIKHIGERYVELRKLYKISQERDDFLPPRRAADLCLSLLLNPHRFFATNCEARGVKPSTVLTHYYKNLQKTLGFDEYTYSMPEVERLIVKLQWELNSNLRLAQEIDSIYRAALIAPPEPAVGIIKKIVTAGAGLGAFFRPVDKPRSTYEDVVRHAVCAIAKKAGAMKQAYLATEPFSAANYDKPITVTGSFPQGRSFHRAISHSEDSDMRGSGDIDIALPSPIVSLWHQYSETILEPWSLHPIGRSKFSTFCPDPALPILTYGPSDGIWRHRTFSPIAFRIYPRRVELVIYDPGATDDSSHELVFPLGDMASAPNYGK